MVDYPPGDPRGLGHEPSPAPPSVVSPRGRALLSYGNLTVIILVMCVAWFVIFHPEILSSYKFFGRGIISTAIICGAVYVVFRLAMPRWSTGVTVFFVLLVLGTSAAMMTDWGQELVQPWMPFQVAPLGLTNITTGQLIVTNESLLFVLILGLIFGLWRSTSGKGEWF